MNPIQRRTVATLPLIVSLATMMTGRAEDKPYVPFVAPASSEGEKAIRQFRVPPGFEARLWAAEPMLANPVAFCFDEKGRCFVAETFRLHAGVTDNRRHMYWLEDDIACRTVADRVAMYRKHAKNKFVESYEKDHDRVKLIWDSKGAGVADQSSVFADGFSKAADGLGSGVLARNGNVYFTCIPDLWLLRDTKNQNRADNRESLSTGYGVHVAFLGHDSHGLRMGPDGRLYFSIGDRGLNVTAKDGSKHFLPDSGAVLRCEPDGSRLEVVHTGLRNPQELAFDDHGNLFTVDNNSDSGDQARLVQIVEGADTGWRMTYQYGTILGDRGPWNAEKMWHLPHEGQPLWSLPPLAHISAGPSGLCYNYGATALPAKYAGHFFLCDFRGGASGSGVWAFQLKPKGASFEVAHREQFIWSILCTDCEFGPDGGLYISDWTEGWNCTGKGRIYRFADQEADKAKAIAETKILIGEGFVHRSINELVKLLEHSDQRVRMEAQFALAAKDEEAIPAIVTVLTTSKNRLARLHALWGLGQIGRRHRESAVVPVMAAAGDADAEVRAQVARVLGDVDGCNAALARQHLERLALDQEPRVRFFAVLSLGKNTRSLDDTSHRAVVPVLRKLASDVDPFVRHAVAIALSRLAPSIVLNPDSNATQNERLQGDVAMATLLALRKQRHIGAANFLDETDPKLVTEAARAINDGPIPDAYRFLAEILNREQLPEFATWRALNANYRLGKLENARAIARFASRTNVPEKQRIEALRMLGTWAKPPQRDRITGIYQPIAERDETAAVDALHGAIGTLLASSDSIRKETISTATKLGIRDIGPSLWALLKDDQRSPAVRAEALRGLTALNDTGLETAIDIGLKSSAPTFRIAARDALADKKPQQAIQAIEQTLGDGTIQEQQAAFATLARMRSPQADLLLAKFIGELRAGKVSPQARLDLVEAAAKRVAEAKSSKTSTLIAQDLATYERSSTGPLAAWRDCQVGGDAERGRDIFLNRADASCVRCHKLNGVGGDVGPELAGIGSRQNREYLLESLVLPDKQIAKGFDSVVLDLKNGKSITGVLRSEDAKEIKLITAEAQTLTISKANIDERRRGKSPMPEDLHQKITKRELRDLVEFLSSLKETKK
jgi:quinoprotein glucose dehydrogenase